MNTHARLLEPTESWPPDYVSHYAWRVKQLRRIRESDRMMRGALAYYSDRPDEFIEHWLDTFDPRNAGKKLPARMPFLLFPRQREFLQFLLECVENESNGLVEKARDMGATWLSVAFSVWLWRFRPGAAIGWGSRKETLVDKIGDPDSIFEKIRQILRYMPPDFLPAGLKWRDHVAWMKIINPENDATITGEAGDNIGRGGRKLIYFKDESAHYERPELIEAALSDNTRVQIDISSVSGPGNVFFRKREAGIEWTPESGVTPGFTNVFIMDWSHHPMKTQTWFDARKASATRDGLLHVFAQEVERNYYAALTGVIIQDEWIAAAIGAADKLGLPVEGKHYAGLDIADDGGDTNALVFRQGIHLTRVEEWGERSTALTARKALGWCQEVGAAMDVEYDCIGPGTGVKAEVNRMMEEDAEFRERVRHIRFIPWHAGAKVQDPEKRVGDDKRAPLNKDFYMNMKAQGWWNLRRRFERTFYAVTEGHEYPVDSLISIDPALPKLQTLRKELGQPVVAYNANGKLMVDKMPAGTRSPNVADAAMMSYFPAKPASLYTLESVYG